VRVPPDIIFPADPPGITAGYHRLWAHKSYLATRPLELFLALFGGGAIEGSIRWWSRDQ
jgi:stearoyl-CoA desaturase (delta-9 desaturase)